jgi:hypothetical protein
MSCDYAISRVPLPDGIKEGKVAPTRLSCHDFRDNEVRLQLFALAYDLGNFLRTLALPQKVEHWTLTTLRAKLIRGQGDAAREVCHLPNRRGGHPEGALCGLLGQNRPLATAAGVRDTLKNS